MITSFVLNTHHVALTRVGERVSLPPVVVLHVKVTENKVDFTLNVTPDKEYSDQGDGLPLIVEERDERMAGKPWGYADRKLLFGNLASPTQLTFWANELAFTIFNSAPNFENLVILLKKK